MHSTDFRATEDADAVSFVCVRVVVGVGVILAVGIVASAVYTVLTFCRFSSSFLQQTPYYNYNELSMVDLPPPKIYLLQSLEEQ